MTPQQPPQQPPEKRRGASLIEIVGWGAVGALIAGLAAVAYFAARPGDDDRPPIIVRNGTVHVEEPLHMKIGKKTRGKLAKSPTAPPGRAIWYHDHGNEKAKKLNVLVGGVAANSCSTTSDFYGADVTKATVYYSVNGLERTGVAYLGANYLELEIDANASATQPIGKEFILDLDGESAKLTKVVLDWAKIGNEGPHTETCTFGDQPPQITLIQSK